MTEQQMPAKFHITWSDGRYFVSIPNYEGGFVVRSDIAERMAEALEELRTDFVRAWGFEPGQENMLYRPTLDRVDSALSAFRSATQDTEARHD